MPTRLFALFLLLSFTAGAQVLTERPEASPPAPPAGVLAPNSHPTYLALRNIGLSGEMANVSNLVLKRDAGTFAFTGTFYFLQPVEGKVTGAVFVGGGTFKLVPPIAIEKRTLAQLTKSGELNETFSKALLRFTDESYEEIKKAGGASQGSADGGAAGMLADHHSTMRKRMRYNLSARILQDVMVPGPGGLFAAFINGQTYNDKMLFIIDPHGVPEITIHRSYGIPGFIQPEEVALITYDENKYGVWTAFHYSHEYAAGKASSTQRNALIDIHHQVLDAAFEKSGRLTGDARTTFAAQGGPARVVGFDLFPKLRVANATDESGAPLHFIQEDKDEDAQFFVILPRTLAAGEKFNLRTTYSGPDAVTNEGGGNYFPVARSNWYPNTSFGDYATYDLTFRVPKGLKTAGTGKLIKEYKEGTEEISEWKADVPQAVAGFNFGQFAVKEKEFSKNFMLYSLANKVEPDWIGTLKAVAGGLPTIEGGGTGERGSSIMDTQGPAIGTMSTVGLSELALQEAFASLQIFTDYFGALPYARLAMSQQTAPGFGQSWPALVYMPILSYIDPTARRQLGIRDTDNFFKSVGPHEVAHQWWGHAVGFSSYRDQWMSEGFAHLSASIYLQFVWKDELFRKFWSDQRERLLEKSQEGHRAIDVGPVTLGYRLLNSKVGFDVPQRLIYPKGGYILHMLRMLMWDNKTRDEKFKHMMRDFVNTYKNRAATTEDFKATVEKHMTPDMDMTGNRRMDWFFDQYVYGTDLPDYRFEHRLSSAADGGHVLWFKITQSNVHPNFHMRVPVYVEVGKNQVIRLGSTDLIGNTSFETEVPLGKLKDKPKRALINYYYDVLSTSDGGKF